MTTTALSHPSHRLLRACFACLLVPLLLAAGAPADAGWADTPRAPRALLVSTPEVPGAGRPGGGPDTLQASTTATPGTATGQNGASGAPQASAPRTPGAAAGATAAASEARFEWPLHPVPPVLRSFDPPDDPYGAGHRGVDLGAAPGQPVLAAGSGVVMFAGTLAGRGVVSVEHDTVRTTYEPLRPSVTVGQQVHAGQQLGTLEAGHGTCETACLHWGVRRGNPPEYLDPLGLVGTTRVRLKPWDG